MPVTLDTQEAEAEGYKFKPSLDNVDSDSK